MNDNRIIKASFRECPLEDRKLFQNSSCLMPISVGQAIHEGRKFIAVLQLINRTFKKCTILVDDTVQRHTRKILFPEKNDSLLYEETLLEGDEWLARNSHTFSELNIPYDIQRWDRWLKHSQFDEQLQKVKDLYQLNSDFHNEINLNIKDYLERHKKHYPNEYFNQSHAFNCCLTYLQEECAIMSLWVYGGYDFEVYPSGRNRAMAATYKYLIAPFYPNLLKPVALRFKKYTAQVTV